MKHNELAYIITDKKTQAENLMRIVQGQDLQALAFTSPNEALDKIGRDDPFLIFIDHSLTTGDSAEFMKILSERLMFGNRSVILVVDFEISDDEKFMMQSLGVSEMIFHPLGEEAIEVCIKNALDCNESIAS